MVAIGLRPDAAGNVAGSTGRMLWFYELFYCEVFMHLLMEKVVPNFLTWLGFLLVAYLAINGFFDLLVRGVLPAIRDIQVYFLGL